MNAIALARLADGELSATELQPCDLVLMSGGFTPSVHLHSQSRGKLDWNAELEAFLPASSAERVRSAGACRGAVRAGCGVGRRHRSWQPAALDATARGRTAVWPAGGRGPTAGAGPAPLAPAARSSGLAGALPRPAQARGRAFVDWQNDVTTRDLALATREGFRSIEHVKRYTTTGMATDQGKTSNLNALGIVAHALGKSIPEVGLTTFRMPYTPVTFGSFAGPARGELFDPVRTHSDARLGVGARRGVRGCRPVEARALLPARRRGHACGGGARVPRSAARVRHLRRLDPRQDRGRRPGCRDLHEPPVRQRLDESRRRVAARYGVLLRDDGFVYDDGVVARLAADRFHVTTTTGGAPRVLAMMEDYLQTEWPDLDVWLTSTTEQWAVIAVQGPSARAVLEGLTDVDMSATALPHMGVATGRICGVPMRLFRVSFTGELGFEVNVPADFGPAVWEAIWDAGQAHGMTPYGTEAMHVLRAEKGYIIVGQDTDGTVTPDDAGLAWAIGKAKADFVGKRSLHAPRHGRSRSPAAGRSSNRRPRRWCWRKARRSWRRRAHGRRLVRSDT